MKIYLDPFLRKRQEYEISYTYSSHKGTVNKKNITYIFGKIFYCMVFIILERFGEIRACGSMYICDSRTLIILKIIILERHICSVMKFMTHNFINYEL